MDSLEANRTTRPRLVQHSCCRLQCSSPSDKRIFGRTDVIIRPRRGHFEPETLVKTPGGGVRPSHLERGTVGSTAGAGPNDMFEQRRPHSSAAKIPPNREIVDVHFVENQPERAERDNALYRHSQHI